MRFLKYLQENYIGIYKYAGMHTEIYENPSPNEIRFMPSIQKKEQHIDPEETIRFLAYAPTQQIFIWKSEGGIHDYVMDYLHSKRKIREAWNSSASAFLQDMQCQKVIKCSLQGDIKFLEAFIMSGVGFQDIFRI